jgi:hypothetical protein
VIGDQKVGGQETPARPRLLGWWIGIAIVAATLSWVVVENIQAARPTPPVAGATSSTAVISAGVAVPIDHSVAAAIDANAEPDRAGASIAAYGP